MEELRLSDLIKQIQKGVNDHHSSEIETDYILEYVDICGERNSTHANPLNKDFEVPYFRNREVSLTGDELIYGEFFLFDYTGHNEEMWLKEFESKEQIEEALLSFDGYTNRFTTYLIPIIQGRYTSYRVLFTNSKDKKDYVFEKGHHDFVTTLKDIEDMKHNLLSCSVDAEDILESVDGKVDYDMLDLRIEWLEEK